MAETTSNCSLEFFDALPANGDKKFLDHTYDPDAKPYYLRRFSPDSGLSTVTNEINLAGFMNELENDPIALAKNGFRGFHTDMESIWWAHADDPFGVWGIATQERHNFYERVTIDFYEIARAPSGWVFSTPDEYLVTKLRTWVLDYMYPEDSETEDEEIVVDQVET